MKKTLILLTLASLFLLIIMGCQKIGDSTKPNEKSANGLNQEVSVNKSLPDKLANPNISVIVWGDEATTQFA